MPTSGDRLVAEVRAELGRARGSARDHLDAATARLAAARSRLSEVRLAAQRVPSRAALTRAERLRSAAGEQAAEMVRLAEAAARAAVRYSADAALAPWYEWRPTLGRPTPDTSRSPDVGVARPEGPPPFVPTQIRVAARDGHSVEPGTEPPAPESPATEPPVPGPTSSPAGSGTEVGQAWPAGSPWAAPARRLAVPSRPVTAATERATTAALPPAPVPGAIPVQRPAPGDPPRALAGLRAAQPVRVGELVVPGAPAVPVLVPLLDHTHLTVTGATGTPPGTLDEMITGLLLRALGDSPAGQVRVYGYDPEQLGGGLAGFAPLGPAGLLTLVGPGGLGALLDELVDHIRRINETVLAGEHGSLRQLATSGRRPEPWRVAVLLGEGAALSRHEQAQLDRIARTGVACGVHLITRGIPVPALPTVRTITVAAGQARVEGFGDLPVTWQPPPAELVTSACRTIAEVALAGPPSTDLTMLLPASLWTESSAHGLRTPIGEGTDGRLAEVTLGDFPPHALLGGPSGTGKTNLIFAWLAGLTARYSPAELELYLLDFKEGVSFARFAPGQRDPSWLPHVRLVGINVNSDREFGLALLRHLAALLRERAEAAKNAEVTTLAELRAEDPTGHWPRIVAVVDEFQVLLAGRDALAAEAVNLLEDLARRGRSQGIHLVLASQDLSGIEALWGRSGLVAQFTLRIALPKARRVLAETNAAADTVPRFHAVINADSGAVQANQTVKVPSASDRPLWTELQQRLWRQRDPAQPPPRLFDGDSVPRLVDAEEFGPAAEESGLVPAEPVALLGAAIDVRARSGRLRLGRAPGRNLAVLGTRVDEAGAVLHCAAVSLARGYPPGTARFSVACLDSDSAAAAATLCAALPPDTIYYDRETLPDLLAATAATLNPGVHVRTLTPHFLVLYAVDAAAGLLAVKRDGGSGADNLRRILQSGPELHTHVLGWWRSVGRLRDDLGGAGARLDSIGAWVALDVHGSELTSLYPHPGGPAWHPRPWRALYFDRSVHRTAEVIIPYG